MIFADLSGTVTLSCSVSPTPALAPTCGLNPAQVKVTSGGQGTSTSTINTTGPTAFLGNPMVRHEPMPAYAVMVPVFLGMVLAGLGLRSERSRRRKLLGLLICCALLGSVVFQAACGGSGSDTTGTSGTPAGVYTITVKGSSTSQHTTTLKLTVQ